MTTTPSMPTPPIAPKEIEPSVGDVFKSLHEKRNETGDFTIKTAAAMESSTIESKPSVASSTAATSSAAAQPVTVESYRCHAFVFRHYWPYFSKAVESTMRESITRELTLSSNIADGGLTLKALEAIGELFYTRSLSNSTCQRLSPVDLISIVANSSLYGFDSIPSLKPLLHLAHNITIDTSNCIAYFRLGHQFKIPDMAAEAENVILANFSEIWAVESNQEILKALPDAIFRLLFFTALSKMTLK